MRGTEPEAVDQARRATARGAYAAGCVVALTAAIAIAPLPSEAAKPKPAKVKPAFAVVAASAAGKKTKASVTASFPLPSGVTAAKACKGKVAASAKVGGKTKTWSGKLSPSIDGPASCGTTINAKLAGGALGMSVALKFVFAGNSAVAGFSVKKSLKIVPPSTPVPGQSPLGGNTPGPPAPAPTSPANTTPASTTPAPTTPENTTPAGPPVSSTPVITYSRGTWASDDSSPLGQVFRWTVGSDGVIHGIQAATFKWKCGDETVFAQLRFDGDVSVLPSGIVTGGYNYVSGQTSVHYSVSMDLGPDTMTGSLSASGTWDYGANGVLSCATTETFTGYHYGAVR